MSKRPSQGSRPFIVAWVVGMLVQVLGLPVLAGVSMRSSRRSSAFPCSPPCPSPSSSGARDDRRRRRGVRRPRRRSGACRSRFVARRRWSLVRGVPDARRDPSWSAATLACDRRRRRCRALALILLGTFVEYTWWTVGMGAGVMAWWRDRRRKTPTEGAEGETARIDPLPLPSGVRAGLRQRTRRRQRS